ncbi:ISAs1 family transposase [Streptomyces sp. NPDC048002]|uniref:ISAs1 family transposase n=1 Tax=Streptomyces sp. NPDC048002 TaxID=3154344 RepID=UPI00340BBBC7
MDAWALARTALVEGRRVVAIDGKTVLGARGGVSSAPHLVAALAHGSKAVLGQVVVGEKSNEIPAARDLLQLLYLDAVVVTMDVLHTQHDTATLMIGAGGDYVLTVKANQKSLYAQLKALPWALIPAVTKTVRGHGRRVTRTIKAVDVPAWIEFSGAMQVAQLRRTVTRKGRRTVEIVCLVTSADAATAPPAVLAAWCSRTGRSKVACTGSAMSPSTRTAHRSAPATYPVSWRAYATPRSPCSAWTDTATSPPPYGIAPATPTPHQPALGSVINFAGPWGNPGLSERALQRAHPFELHRTRGTGSEGARAVTEGRRRGRRGHGVRVWCGRTEGVRR